MNQPIVQKNYLADSAEVTHFDNEENAESKAKMKFKMPKKNKVEKSDEKFQRSAERDAVKSQKAAEKAQKKEERAQRRKADMTSQTDTTLVAGTSDLPSWVTDLQKDMIDEANGDKKSEVSYDITEMPEDEKTPAPVTMTPEWALKKGNGYDAPASPSIESPLFEDHEPALPIVTQTNNLSEDIGDNKVEEKPIQAQSPVSPTLPKEEDPGWLYAGVDDEDFAVPFAELAPVPGFGEEDKAVDTKEEEGESQEEVELVAKQVVIQEDTDAHNKEKHITNPITDSKNVPTLEENMAWDKNVADYEKRAAEKDPTITPAERLAMEIRHMSTRMHSMLSDLELKDAKSQLELDAAKAETAQARAEAETAKADYSLVNQEADVLAAEVAEEKKKVAELEAKLTAMEAEKLEASNKVVEVAPVVDETEVVELKEKVSHLSTLLEEQERNMSSVLSAQSSLAVASATSERLKIENKARSLIEGKIDQETFKAIFGNEAYKDLILSK
jgi:hypothetical protein